jgi:hypothetical protein
MTGEGRPPSGGCSCCSVGRCAQSGGSAGARRALPQGCRHRDRRRRRCCARRWRAG